MKQIILKEKSLFLIKESIDDVVALQPYIDHLAYKVKEVMEHFRKNCILYNQKFPNKYFNISLFNDNFPNIKDVTSWFYENNPTQNIKKALRCFITKVDDDENGDDNGFKHNMLYDLFKREVSVYYIFKKPIPDKEEQNIMFDNRIKVFINDSIDTSSIYQTAREQISHTLMLLDKKRNKELEKPIKYDDAFKSLPNEFQLIVSNLWNKSNMEVLANSPIFSIHGSDMQQNVCNALKTIENTDLNNEVWEILNNILNLGLYSNDEIKEYFVSESNRIYENEFIPALQPALKLQQELEEKNRYYIEYFKTHQYLYYNTEYGQLRINGKQRNGYCAASIWMDKGAENGGIAQVMNNNQKDLIVKDKEGNLAEAIKRTIELMVNVIIKKAIYNNHFKPLPNLTWEEAKQLSQRK